MTQMKCPFSVAIVAPLLLFALDSGSPRGFESQASPAVITRHPVLVELFTSEGCSTCPPADDFLVRLVDRQPVADAEVIALEEHVDYFNHEGWIDPFSKHEWTDRQQVYITKFKKGTVYTPEMIVDGETELVAIHEQQGREAIANAAHPETVPIEIISLKSAPDREQQFTVHVGKFPGGTPSQTADVWLAITEKGLHSAVNRGENAGRDLHHAPVLRTLRKIGVADPGKQPFSYEGNQAVKVNADWKRENLSVVVFVQEKKSLRIIGAASAPLAD
jgi:hypothetical protein